MDYNQSSGLYTIRSLLDFDTFICMHGTPLDAKAKLKVRHQIKTQDSKLNSKLASKYADQHVACQRVVSLPTEGRTL